MKIALLTIWHVCNYGAELQAYATTKILRDLGHEVTMIDIRENEHPNPSLKNRMAEFISRLTPAYRNFNNFWQKYIPSKTRHYRSIDDLIANPPAADVYMVGSDQVWNKDITAEKRYIYFLNFGADYVKRISYASSFGMGKWADDEFSTKQTGDLLKRFSSISCREKSGVSILKREFGLDAKRVLDPTLMLNNYSNITGEVTATPTLAYYPLTHYPELDAFCINLAERLKLRPVNANNTIKLTNSIPWRRPSVKEWITAIAQASFVVTPSFHGLAFSILYQRQFMIINRGGSNERRSRMTDLLSELGLSDRFCESFEEAEEKRLWEKKIDYEAVNRRLEAMRQESYEYLKKSLE